MGMFDSIYVKCPKCDTSQEVQSKAGECLLHSYDQDRVPIAIAADLNGEEVKCNHCGLLCVVVSLPTPPTSTKVRLVKS